MFKTQMSVTSIMAVPSRKKCWKSPLSILDFFLQEIENKHTDSRRRNRAEREMRASAFLPNSSSRKPHASLVELLIPQNG